LENFNRKNLIHQKISQNLLVLSKLLLTKISEVFKKLSPKQLDTPYREGGWTARQVLHHLADSHMHAYIRFKWTLNGRQSNNKSIQRKALG
jgi:hypothetical protein